MGVTIIEFSYEAGVPLSVDYLVFMNFPVRCTWSRRALHDCGQIARTLRTTGCRRVFRSLALKAARH
ncbi:hypothetical protein GE21DRAFT_1121192 [Neurospora crassa]|nr:hypothetical protein GE21DRAFT_1121192 [Neurospora crassa]